MCCCIIIIKKNKKTDWDIYIWMGLKILTFKKEMKINNFELLPIINIGPDGPEIKYDETYESLLSHSGENYENNYKKCGILDTYGNIMCIPKEKGCPINNILVDSCQNNAKYGYQRTYLKNMAYGNCLYYTNRDTNNEIIVKIKFNDDIPRYINDNFIFDESLYKSYQKDLNADSVGGGVGGDFFRNLEEKVYGDERMTKIVKEKFKEEINIDKSFKRIDYNLYDGNYIGFEDHTHLQKYNNFDLYKSYFDVFPDELAVAFCYFTIILFSCMIIFSMIRCCDKNYPVESFDPLCVLGTKLSIIIAYSITFIIYFIYTFYEYFNIYIKRNLKDFTKIRANEFIENLLADIEKKNTKESFILAIIILLPFSLLLFLSGWIVCIFVTKWYKKQYKNNNQIIIF